MTDKIPLLEGTTPGPWGLEITDKTIWLGTIKTNANGSKVDVVVADFDCGLDYTEAFNARQLANARLIAAAPDLARRAASADKLVAALQPFKREHADMRLGAHLKDEQLMLDVDCGGEILTVGDWRKLIQALSEWEAGESALAEQEKTDGR
jgi:hypothetical protein